MPLRLRDISNEELRRWCGFSLFAAWLVLLPRTVMTNSTVMHSHALALGCVFVALFVVLAAADAVRAGRGERILLVLCAVVGTVSGLAFLAQPGTNARFACFAAEMAACIGLLLHWGRLLATQPLDKLFACALGALAATAALHFLVVGLGTAVSLLGNAHAFSDFMLGALALLPAASSLLGWPTTPHASDTLRTEGSDAAFTPPEDAAIEPVRESRSKATRASVPLSYAVILCLASFIASFVSGFTYLPHYVDWNLTASLRSAIVLAAAVCAGWYLLRKPVLTLSHANVLLLFSLLLTVLGLSALTVNDPAVSVVARGMLDAARDCYFAVALVLLCGLVREYRLPFLPAFALGMLGTGLFWGYDLGVFAKRLLGYDLQTLAPLSAACTAVLAAAFFLLFVRGPGRASESVGVAEAARGGESPEVQAPVDGTASADETRKAPEPEPQLDAASARQIIEKTHEDVLAPYQLSPRELQVSLLVLDGFTAAAASEKLGISIATVKFHLGNAYRKIGIQSKSELVQLAKRSEEAIVDEGKETPHAE
ncbi:helix-turn-helix transcriptional regulator [Gordonibacter massiliensis (ex Traore et al. 2017)]|uniref:HTH luxR-type domain-containing protein n=1 Tax=Gordonibacter massiliensis (ex Traore et al. 2017) TaxID=1841863 RepID=A0A842JIE9_9ACTN|nr:hypothetical protein [Gordonibacter massiliensis (ex Traore et al. 2017)]